MKNNTLITAKTFFRMAEADRKLLVVSGAVNTILTVSLIIKLSVAAVCLIKNCCNNS